MKHPAFAWLGTALTAGLFVTGPSVGAQEPDTAHTIVVSKRFERAVVFDDVATVVPTFGYVITYAAAPYTMTVQPVNDPSLVFYLSFSPHQSGTDVRISGVGTDSGISGTIVQGTGTMKGGASFAIDRKARRGGPWRRMEELAQALR